MTEDSSAITGKSTTRRAALAVGGIAAAGAVAAVVATPGAAEAASGSALILGRANSATTGTTITSVTSAPALTVTNSGPAALFKSTDSNGFAGGSSFKNGYGLSAANYTSAQGSGAALAASGGANSGALINTTGNNRYAVNAAFNGATATAQTTGAGNFIGNLGEGVVASSVGDPSQFAGVTGLQGSAGVGVWGQSFGDESASVVGWCDGNASSQGVYAYANWTDDSTAALVADAHSSSADAIQALGRVVITGDLLVSGTIYCPNDVVVGPLPTSAQARAMVRRSAKMASRFRPRKI